MLTLNFNNLLVREMYVVFYFNSCSSSIQNKRQTRIRIRQKLNFFHTKDKRNHSCELCLQTLKQACFQEYPEAQFAFKNLMIH